SFLQCDLPHSTLPPGNMRHDDYPMTSIENKQKWMKYGAEKGAWFTFYHDAYYRAVKWNEEGHIVEKIERKTSIEA
ncbi:hypothetical protein ACT4UT_09830, partial [Bacillus sp. B-TM1]